MRLPGQGLSWLSVRNVLEVDGQPVTDSHDRLERAINGDPRGLAARLQSVAGEGARFNIGGITRNFNDPILPLLFLDPVYQPRFKFHLEGKETVNDIDTTVLALEQTFQILESLTAEAGLPHDLWDARRIVLERTLISVVRSYRLRLLSQPARQSQKSSGG